MIEQLTFQSGEGKFQVKMLVAITDEGLTAQIFGGERPHVGAIALSIPRPGLADPEKISCNTAVLPLLGHKDDELAKPLAEEIARIWGNPVVVVVGVHIDNADEKDIQLLIQNCRKVTTELVNHLQKLK